MKLKNREHSTLSFKLGDWVLEHVVIFVCIYMLLVAVLCYCYIYDTYDMIFIISILKSNNNMLSGSAPPPPQPQWKILCGLLVKGLEM
jgi:hypothetical protein